MFLSEIFQSIFNFLANNFELFIFVYFITAFIYFVFLLIIFYVDLLNKKFLPSAFMHLVHFVIIFGVTLSVLTSLYIYWINYQNPLTTLIKFPEDVLVNTNWVKDEEMLYFIDARELKTIRMDGRDPRTLFKADSDIKEYHFSPDGKFLLIVTDNNLNLLDLRTKKSQAIDEIHTGEFKGAISGIQWAPHSRAFVYGKSLWSGYGSQDLLIMYDLKTQEKKSMPTPPRKTSGLYWDKIGENLYFLQYDLVKETEVYPYRIKVIRIPVQSWTTEFVAQSASKGTVAPMENLLAYGIDLALDQARVSFTSSSPKEFWVSEKKMRVGIDSKDFLYLIRKNWFRKRLFQIPRDALPEHVADMHRYQYQGGPLTISQIRWLPGSRYILMIHRDMGALILDPLQGKMGRLLAVHGGTFGWYQKEPLPSQKDFGEEFDPMNYFRDVQKRLLPWLQ